MKKKLKIAQLVPPFLPVPPKKYGGTELIAYYLCEGLTERGHRVTLFASGDSKTKARLVSVYDKSLYGQKVAWSDPYYPLLQITSCAEHLKEFDIIHNHFHYFGLALGFFTRARMLTTYHGDFNSLPPGSPRHRLLKQFAGANFVSISHSQRKVKGLKLNFVATVYNGIDVSQFKFSEKPGNYLAWLGRITPKKGLSEAIAIAKKAGLPLKIAAKVDRNVRSDVEFFNNKIKPLIAKKQIDYLGEIGGHKAKSDFLTGALALLNPIKWQEPFGLNMAEAMACGTPVIAFDRGSVRELIEHKKTGYIVKDVAQAAKAVKNISQLDRSACRRRVEEKFNKDKMVAEYEKLYYQLLD